MKQLYIDPAMQDAVWGILITFFLIGIVLVILLAIVWIFRMLLSGYESNPDNNESDSKDDDTNFFNFQ